MQHLSPPFPLPGQEPKLAVVGHIQTLPGLRRVGTGVNSRETLVPSTGVMEIVRVPVAAISPGPVGILPEDFVSVVLH